MTTADVAPHPLHPDGLHPVDDVNAFRDLEREHDAAVERIIARATKPVTMVGGPYDGQSFTTTVPVMLLADPDQVKDPSFDGTAPVIVHTYRVERPGEAVYCGRRAW